MCRLQGIARGKDGITTMNSSCATVSFVATTQQVYASLVTPAQPTNNATPPPEPPRSSTPRLQPHQQTCRRCLQQLQPRPYLDLVFLHLLPLMPIKAVIPQNIEDHAKSRRPITTTATEIEIRTMATVRDPLVGDSVKVPTVMILTTIPPTDAGDETNIPAFKIGRSTLASFFGVTMLLPLGATPTPDLFREKGYILR